jgi:hypothetical protein
MERRTYPIIILRRNLSKLASLHLGTILNLIEGRATIKVFANSAKNVRDMNDKFPLRTSGSVPRALAVSLRLPRSRAALDESPCRDP